MSENIVVPILGESITEATVSKWLKKSGDKVNADEPIVELETDKVNLEVPSPINGILSEIKTKEGQTVEVGALLGIISDDEISYTDYKYTKIFEQADMSGTSDVTGDCLYYMTVNTGGVVMDEAHFVQCVLNEKIIQVYLYEDYTSVDESFAFELMDIMLRKINDTSIQ